MTANATDASGERFLDRQRNVIIVLAAIVLLALILELPTLNMGRWLDECLNLASASQPDIPTLIKTMYGRLEDQHPPLSYMLLFCFTRVFGSGDIAIRVPSMLCGLLLIPATYSLGETVHSKAAGLLSAFFVAISPFANYLLCQSRPYALATLISAVTLTLFCKLVDDRNEKHRTATFIGLSLMVAALCYTEYSSCPMVPALGLASIVIYFRDRLAGMPAPQSVARLKRCLAALFLGGALFIPWIPSLLMQSHVGVPLAEPTPLAILPQAFAYNVLLASVPLPMIVVIPLSVLASLAFLLWLLRHRLPGLKPLFCSIPATYWVLICALAFPASVLELIIPFFWGYYRYIFPYSPAGWVLFAIVMLRLFGYGQQGNKIRIFLPITLASMLALNLLYLWWFDSRPQSGMRTLAQDARAGKYDSCVLLVAPDYITQTLDYYLPLAERGAHHIALYGFPRWENPMAPVKMSEIPPLWAEKTVGEAEQHLVELHTQGWKKLAFATNAEMLDRVHSNTAIPRGQRVSELRTFIEHNFKKLPTELEYPGATEALKVTFFQLEPELHSPR